MGQSKTSVWRTCALGVACAVGLALGPPSVASAQTTIQGDINGDGGVGFDDLMLLLANWQGNAPQNLGWGVIAPSVMAVHQLQVQSVEETACILVLNLDAEYVVQLLDQPHKRRGMRSLSRPGGWPSWPPPGSAIEQLMERMTSDPESVERLAQAMLDALPPDGDRQPPEVPEPGENPDGPDGPDDNPDDPDGPDDNPDDPDGPESPPPETPEPPEPTEEPEEPTPAELPDEVS